MQNGKSYRCNEKEVVIVKHLSRICLLLALFCAVVSVPTLAAEIVYDEVYHFSDADFATEDASAAPRGIVLTAVPELSVGQLICSGRRLRAGDAIPAELFSRVRFEPTCTGGQTAELRWIPVYAAHPAPSASFLIQIGDGRNLPPTAEDGSLETYRNIPIEGQLVFSDPDDDALRFEVTNEPRRGSVTVRSDGSYLYTPQKNKVGKDAFTVLMTDSAGNTAEATVRVMIVKPTDRTTFADLVGDRDQFYAMWLREQGLYSGQTLSGTLLFQPEQPVSRGEFLVMAMKLLGFEPEEETLSTGFADEEETPVWLRPYLVSALRAGLITGVASPEGLVFRHAAAVTQAEAAVMLDHMLGLSNRQTVPVFHDDDLPAWAGDAVSCLSECGVHGLDQPSKSLAMRQVAALLYQVHQLTQQRPLTNGLLSWAADA